MKKMLFVMCALTALMSAVAEGTQEGGYGAYSDEYGEYGSEYEDESGGYYEGSGYDSAETAKDYYDRGLAYYNARDYDRAIEELSAALWLDSAYTNAYYYRGIAYHYKKDYDRAIADYTELIRLKPDYAPAYYNRGVSHYNNDDYDKALKDYTRAIKVDPTYAAAYNSRGHVYNEKKDYDRAIADFNEAIRLNPNSAYAYNNRGRAYAGKEDYNRAIADYTQALRLDSDYETAYANRGNAYYNKKDYDRAIADYTQALRLDPEWGGYYNSRGHAYREKRDYDRAIADYTQALRLDPEWDGYYYSRGYTYHVKEDYDRAIADYSQALRLNPGNTSASAHRDAAQAAKEHQLMQARTSQQQAPATPQQTTATPQQALVTAQQTTARTAPQTASGSAAAYRTDTPDPLIKNAAASVGTPRSMNPEEFIRRLALFINQNSANDFDKVKKAHDWVALNIRYDAAGFLSGNTPSQSLGNVLTSGLAVCQGYSDVLKALLDALNIESVTISGYGRGYGATIFTIDDPRNSNHAWNKVKINGTWYLIDSTWDAGHLDGRQYVADYSTGYLFLEPDKFVYTHFPTNPAEQLLAKPLSAAEFSRLPKTWPRYFTSVSNLNIARINSAAGTGVIELALTKDWIVDFNVYNESGSQKLDNRSFVQKEGNVVKAYFSFPRAGRYVITGFAKKQGEETGWSCVEFGIESTTGSTVLYPTTYSSFGLETTIMSPIEMPLRRGRTYTFNFKTDKPFAAVIVDGQWHKLTPDRNGTVSAAISIPGGASSVTINVSDQANGTYNTLAQYTVD
ncbi:putative Cell division coordinator CpoB [Pillotina sp. SPG140]|jgi:tetratricopeptide (TPR) repeat protein